MVKQTDFPAYSIALYGRGKVEERCLRLQEEYGLDVNAVLFCYWFGAHHGVIGEDLWARIDEISSQWQSRLIQPLREARRWLKRSGYETDREKHHALRERIKADEIAAELLQQRTMQVASEATEASAPEEPAAAARRNAEALLRRRGIALDDEVNQLLAAISSAAFDWRH